MESNEITPSFFPPPPPRYKLFTNYNIELAQKLKVTSEEEHHKTITTPFDPEKQKNQILSILQSSSTESPSNHPNPANHNQTLDKQVQEVLTGQTDLRTLLCPPNLDWIKENAGWSSFGDWQAWPDSAVQTSLEGMPKLYDEKIERKAALQGLLNTLIYSYLELLEVLGTEGPTSLQVQQEGEATSQQQDQPMSSKTDQLVSHIELVAFNMHGLCNELRPRQARETLKLMMKEQACIKREKAKRMISTCEELRTQLSELKIKG